MGTILSAYIFPHPPVIIPEVGKGAESGASGTIRAVKEAAGRISEEMPDTVIVTTPHGPVFQDFIYVSSKERLKGNMGRFGAEGVGLSFENDLELAAAIIKYASREGIYAGDLEESLMRKYKLSAELDHGALVPLYFIRESSRPFRLVHISIAGLPFIELYRFGMCIAKAVRALERRVVFLASGDLSHRLSEDGPYGFHEMGPRFDRMLTDSIRSGNVEELLQTSEEFCESAGECGLRSFLMMFGALDGVKIAPEVLSYEGPFGVGYCVARIGTGEEDPARKILDRVEEQNLKAILAVRQKEDPYVQLARSALETYVREGRVLPVPDGLPAEMLTEKAGTFVSLKKQGQLRGCIGTIGPTAPNVAGEIIQNAISSGTRDPRFDPVTEEELDRLVYSVDVLKPAEPISSMEELDVVKYGVIVKAGSRSGLLLPNLEGVDTPEKQVSIALQKAGIRPDEKYRMERFEVVRHK